MTYMDKHSTLDPVMVSVVSSIPNGGNILLNFFKPHDVNSGLKCKYDLVVKTSFEFHLLCEVSLFSSGTDGQSAHCVIQ